MAAEGVAGREPQRSPPESGPRSLTTRSCGRSHVFPGTGSLADGIGVLWGRERMATRWRLHQPEARSLKPGVSPHAVCGLRRRSFLPPPAPGAAGTLGLWPHRSRLGPHGRVAASPCICVPAAPLTRTPVTEVRARLASPGWSRLHLHLNHICKDPSSEEGHIFGSQSLELRRIFWGPLIPP